MSEGPFGRRAEPADGPAPAPVPEPAPPRPPRVTSTVTWVVGVVVVLFIAAVTVNSITTEGPGSRGIPDGEPLPPFAAPLATSALQGDAQVDPQKACRVRGPDVVNSCELRARGPVVLAFLATRGKQCLEEIDVIDRVRTRHAGVQFAAVAIRGDRKEVDDIVRERGWQLPVAHDRDGAVANLYAVAVCPTITIAGADGKVASTTFGTVDERALERRIAEVER